MAAYAESSLICTMLSHSTTNRNGYVEHAASQALAATRRTIKREFSTPTAEQGRVMGVESVVEGVKWDLSTEQLQVLCALVLLHANTTHNREGLPRVGFFYYLSVVLIAPAGFTFARFIPISLGLSPWRTVVMTAARIFTHAESVALQLTVA